MNNVDPKVAAFIKARDANRKAVIASGVDRKAAKALLNNFLKVVIDEAGARMPADMQAAERQTWVLSLLRPDLRSAMIEFYTRHIYGAPTRKSRKAAEVRNGAR